MIKESSKDMKDCIKLSIDLFDKFKDKAVNKIIYEEREKFSKINDNWQKYCILQDSITFSLDALTQDASGKELYALGTFQALIIIQDGCKELCGLLSPLSLVYEENTNTRDFRNRYLSHPISNKKERQDIGTSINFGIGMTAEYLKDNTTKYSPLGILEGLIEQSIEDEMKNFSSFFQSILDALDNQPKTE